MSRQIFIRIYVGIFQVQVQVLARKAACLVLGIFHNWITDFIVESVVAACTAT